MKTINATNARKNLYQLINAVHDESTPYIITNNNGKNAVLISEDDWDAISETLYLNSIPGLVESVNESSLNDIEGLEHFDPNEEW